MGSLVKFLQGIGTVVALVSATNAGAATAFANQQTPTAIGTLTAGQSYSVTATGTADLCAGCSAGNLIFAPDGTPVSATGAYAGFNPSGKDYDVSIGTSAYGIGGAGKLYGALLGTFTATPTSAADYFTIGSGITLTADSDKTLYAVINDSFFPNNSGSYSVSLSLSPPASAVPEPATWAMMLVGFGAVGASMRVRKTSARIRLA